MDLLFIFAAVVCVWAILSVMGNERAQGMARIRVLARQQPKGRKDEEEPILVGSPSDDNRLKR